MDGVTIRLTDAHVAAIADSVNEGRVVVALAKEVQEARQRRCEHCRSWYRDATYKPGFGHCMQFSSNSAAWWFCADFASKSEPVTLDSRAVADGH